MVIIHRPTINGEWKHLFNPNRSSFPERQKLLTRNKWYTNDHCIIKGLDGLWHGYGIIGYKILGVALPWKIETQLFHIVSNQLDAENWEEKPYAITADNSIGERFVWAPHALLSNQQYHMVYAVGDLKRGSPILSSYGKIHHAISDDGYHWTRDPLNPISIEPGNARDPFLFHHKDHFYLYFTRSKSENDNHSCVGLKKSPDLIHWSGTQIIFTYPKIKGWFAGNTESPFIVEYQGLFYLFICPALEHYNFTRVYWSDSLENFPIENYVCDLPTHASEIIYDTERGWFITNTGWDKKGLYLSSLKWEKV